MYNKIIGIYGIYNRITNQWYIGKSENIKYRKQTHYRNLKNNIHCNHYLQNAYNKYGLENLIFQLIQECSKEQLTQREIEMIKYFNSYYKLNGYNLTEGGDGGKIYEKEIYQYDLQGNFIKKWNSTAEASRVLNCNYHGIFDCIRKQRKHYLNSQWSNIKADKIKPSILKHKPRVKTGVLQYDLNNNFINIFDTLKDASQHFNKNTGVYLGQVLKHGNGELWGYKWKYKQEK